MIFRTLSALLFLTNVLFSDSLVLDVIPHKYTISLSEFMTIKELFQPSIFVETGTFRGYSTEVAATLFDEVKTIELCPEIYLDTKKRLEPYYQNIEFFLGNSASVLPEISKSLKSRAFFYLDAHFCFNGTAKDFNDPPVMGELEGILKYAPSDSVIIIDDLRIFANNQRLPFDAYNYYPSILDISNFLKAIAPEFSLFILGDEAIIFNQNCYSIQVSDLVMSITKSLVNEDLDLILEGDLGLMKLSNENIEKLKQLDILYTDMDRSLISFWLGCAYFLKDRELSLEYFTRAENCGFYHPRIYAYKSALVGGSKDYKKQFLKKFKKRHDVIESIASLL
jgi:hypothetical protein